MFNKKTDKAMKKYIKPNIEQLDVELEQMIATSVDIVDDLATDTEGFYNDSRVDSFLEE